MIADICAAVLSACVRKQSISTLMSASPLQQQTSISVSTISSAAITIAVLTAEGAVIPEMTVVMAPMSGVVGVRLV